MSLKSGELLHKRIIEAGLSQRKVAEKMGLRPETVHRHVNNKTNLSIRDAKRYAKILNCPPESLIFDPEPMPVIGEFSDEDRHVKLYPPNVFKSITWRVSPPIQWRAIKRVSKHEWLNDCYFIVDRTSMINHAIDQETLAKLSLVCNLNGETSIAVPYPKPNNKFTLRHILFGKSQINEKQLIQDDVELLWACPIILTTFVLKDSGSGEELS
jgi:transcriptional regulator with XRE-family HTH domain